MRIQAIEVKDSKNNYWDVKKKSSVIKKKLVCSESLDDSTQPNKSVLEDRSMTDKAERRKKVSNIRKHRGLENEY